MALKGVASQVNTGTGLTCVVNVAGIGIAAGDYIVFSAGGGGGSTNTFSFPSGFTQPLANQSVQGVNTAGLGIKVATGTEGATLTFTSSVSDFQSGHVRVYSGRSGLLTASIATANANAPSPIAIAGTSISAAAGDDVCVLINAKYYDPTTQAYTGFVAGGGYGNGALIDTPVQFTPVICAEDAINVAAGSFSASGTLSFTGGSSIGYTSYILALAKASSGGGGGPNGLMGMQGYPGFSLIRLGGR